MTIDQDLEKIALQEKRLQFKHFDSTVAWAVGSALKAAAEKSGVAVAIDVQLNGHALFSYAMPGTTPDNWDWIRRKRNVVQRYHRSSYAIGLTHQRAQTTLQAKTGLDLKDYAPHGGCFPDFPRGLGMRRHDHRLRVAAARGSQSGRCRASGLLCIWPAKI